MSGSLALLVWSNHGQLHLFQAHTFRDWVKLITTEALLLKQMPKKQTGFVLLQKQNKSDLVFHHQIDLVFHDQN